LNRHGAGKNNFSDGVAAGKKKARLAQRRFPSFSHFSMRKKMRKNKSRERACQAHDLRHVKKRKKNLHPIGKLL